MKDVRKTTILVLSIVVALLLISVLYLAVFKPQYQQFVYEKQLEGVNEGINYVINQVLTQGYVQLQVENETLILVPYSPESTTTQ